MGLLSRLLGTEGAARDLLADLTEDYRAEAAQAALLRAHAERARYPQAASALRGLAEMEARHAERLRTHLLALGGQPPAAAPATGGGNNQWARAVAARHAASPGWPPRRRPPAVCLRAAAAPPGPWEARNEGVRPRATAS